MTFTEQAAAEAKRLREIATEATKGAETLEELIGAKTVELESRKRRGRKRTPPRVAREEGRREIAEAVTEAPLKHRILEGLANQGDATIEQLSRDIVANADDVQRALASMQAVRDVEPLLDAGEQLDSIATFWQITTKGRREYASANRGMLSRTEITASRKDDDGGDEDETEDGRAEADWRAGTAPVA